MPTKLLVATTNPGKLAEVRAFLRVFAFEIVSLDQVAGCPSIVEDGATFEDNARKKASTMALYSGYPTLADDSGLEVDALAGAPGIYSARYAGADANDEKNNHKLLQELRLIPEQDRSARFVCALAFCGPGRTSMDPWTARETCEGIIAPAPRGKNGFGYDPLFFYPPLGKTFGELDRSAKAAVSHRGKALRRFAEALPGFMAL